MSLFREGYVSVLPSELRQELRKFYFKWADNLIVLSTEYQNILISEQAEFEAEQTGDTINYQPVTMQDYIYFDISIFPCLSKVKLYFPFQVYFIALKTFLKYYINTHEFKFVVPDQLRPDRNLQKKLKPTAKADMERDKDNATRGQLFNEKEFVNVFIQRIEIDLGIYYMSTEEEHPLYELTDIQSELFIYKLIKFYNDLVTIAETNNDLKDEY